MVSPSTRKRIGTLPTARQQAPLWADVTSCGRFVSGRSMQIERDFERSSLPQLELVSAQKLDWVLHAHHPEVATATGDAVVNGVA